MQYSPATNPEENPHSYEKWVDARLKERLALIKSGKAIFISHEEVVLKSRERLKAVIETIQKSRSQ
jgi:hypothetical protein